VPSYREEGETRAGVELTDDELTSADAVVIVTDHTGIDWQRIVDRARVIVDTRNATSKTTTGGGRVVSLATAPLRYAPPEAGLVAAH
jgi:UDP-N-acetyl-D-glucosamine dehydrogenase